MALQPFGPHNRQEDQKLSARIFAELHKVQPVILLVFGIAAWLGVKIIWPPEQIADLAVRVEALEKNSAEMARTLTVLANAKCVELTPEQIAVAGIDCSRVLERMDQSAALARRRADPRR